MLAKIKKRIKRFFYKYWRVILLVFVCILFFVGTASYNYINQEDGFVKWGSPDETANYTFAKLYGQEGRFTIYERYNLFTKDIMHPRSFRSDFGFLEPMSFIGLPLIYGKIVSFTTYKILPFLTPVFASFGLIFFYLLIKKLFSRNIAIISALLLASFPPFLYYTVRGMIHNVLFVSLLIAGLYFAVAMNLKKKKKKNDWLSWIYAGLAGSLIGLAIITRTSELLWIAPLLFLLWLFNIKKTSITKLIIFISFLFVSILPALFYNKVLYGSFVSGGYPEMNQSIVNITEASTDLVKSTVKFNFSFHNDLVKKIRDNVFVFGFDFRQSIKMGYYYFADMFYWIFWPAILGGVLWIMDFKKRKKKHWVYLFSYLIISLILIFYYGSWEFHDNPDPKSFTIGNSYTRYWLPIYLGALPFVSLFIIRFTNALKSLFKFFIINKDDDKKFCSSKINKKLFIFSTRLAIISIIYFISINFVLVGSEEGLATSHIKYMEAKKEWEKALSLTENNSVIITQYHDKIFFPERKVIVGLFNNDLMIAEYANIVDLLPTYYYNFTFPEKDINYLNNSRLKKFDLQIEEVEKIGDLSLYKLEKIKKENTTETQIGEGKNE